jgi:hypothetical protein
MITVEKCGILSLELLGKYELWKNNYSVAVVNSHILAAVLLTANFLTFVFISPHNI